MNKPKPFIDVRARIILLLILTIGLAPSTYGQERSISGLVTSSENNEPLPGVTVTIPGTSTGTVTDLNGKYRLTLSGVADKIQFSYIGFSTQVVDIGSRTVIDVQLEVDNRQLEEIVVTALGVDKQVKALGYSVTEFEGSNMAKARESNPISTLTGKVAGLSIKTATDFFQNPDIKLRGGSPLVVIDGVPNPNADFWEISSDDIENISVLKGATASALYGSLGKNGALMITTKRGKDKLEIEFNSSTQMQTGFLRAPSPQSVYGTGDGGQYEYVNGSGALGVWVWGPRLDEIDPNTGEIWKTKQIDSPIDQITGERIPTPFVSQGKDNIKNFFETGAIQTSSLSLTGGNEEGSFRASLSNSYQKGQVPNTELNINGISVAGTYNLSEKLKVDASLNYGRQESDNYPGLEYSSRSYLYSIMWMGLNIDIRDLRDYWEEGQEGYQQKQWNTQWFNNPYFTAYEYNQGWYRNSSYGQVSASYNFLEGLDFRVRSGYSSYSTRSTEKEPKSYLSTFNVVSDGNYFIDNQSNFNFNTDAILSYDLKLSENLKLISAAGTSIRTAQYLQSSVNTDGLIVPNYYNIANSKNPLTGSNRQSEELVASAYGTLDFELYNSIFLGLTGRNDWVSTLPTHNNSFFYPSISSSVAISEVVELPGPISFLKVRGSWSQVSNGSITSGGNRPYNHVTAYNKGTSWNSVNSVNYPNVIINPDIKPETSNTWEIGLDTRLYEGRLALDVAYYNVLDFNNILSVQVSETSGFGSRLENGGEYRRKGIEFLLTGTPIKTNNLRWDLATNWTQSRRYLEKAFDDSGQLGLIKEGHRMDEFWQEVFERSPGGQIIIENGTRKTDPFQRKIGYDDADWVYGLQSNLTYKNLSFGVSGDGRIGGLIASWTNAEMHWSGLHPNTVRPERDDANKGISSYIDPGLVVVSGSVIYDLQGNITEDTRVYAPNSTEVNYISWAKDIYNTIEAVEDFTYKETFFKLREAIITYKIPNKWLDKIFLTDATISAVGRNLILLSSVPQIDPDQGEDWRFQSPSTRNFGFNINFKF